MVDQTIALALLSAQWLATPQHPDIDDCCTVASQSEVLAGETVPVPPEGRATLQHFAATGQASVLMQIMDTKWHAAWCGSVCLQVLVYSSPASLLTASIWSLTDNLA
jgi:hypothetical protein